ncbi:MAG: FtsQ-type POTRA domain-containing protein [Lachnospiraceae bacterium]|nr:FtsQ-type POTRA domain-containing protein [Lachnospiraceae bacterium]
MVLLVAVLGGAGLYILNFYTIRTVYVEGNVHYSEEEIKSIVMDGFLGDNSLYLSMKYKRKGIEGIPFVDEMDVEILSPDTIRITVYEKALTGCIRYMDTYVYFDRDGYVVESSAVRTVGVPQVMGLKFEHIVTGDKIPVENEAVFNSILNITRMLQKYSLTADKIYFKDSGDITIYFQNIKVALGNNSATLEDKLMLLPDLLPRLEGKSGILQMQNYDGGGGKYIFKPEG